MPFKHTYFFKPQKILFQHKFAQPLCLRSKIYLKNCQNSNESKSIKTTRQNTFRAT